MEWKKVKFMEDRVGEDFDGLIISVTKFGFFVELTDLFIEGLVPLDSLTDDRYTYHENTREIIGAAQPQDLQLGAEDTGSRGPHRSCRKEDPVRRRRRETVATRKAKTLVGWPRARPHPRPGAKIRVHVSEKQRRPHETAPTGVKFLSQPHPLRLERSSGSPARRDVAQPGRALAWGARGRQFKSARPDQFTALDLRTTNSVVGV